MIYLDSIFIKIFAIWVLLVVLGLVVRGFILYIVYKQVSTLEEDENGDVKKSPRNFRKLFWSWFFLK